MKNHVRFTDVFNKGVKKIPAPFVVRGSFCFSEAEVICKIIQNSLCPLPANKKGEGFWYNAVDKSKI